MFPASSPFNEAALANPERIAIITFQLREIFIAVPPGLLSLSSREQSPPGKQSVHSASFLLRILELAANPGWLIADLAALGCL